MLREAFLRQLVAGLPLVGAERGVEDVLALDLGRIHDVREALRVRQGPLEDALALEKEPPAKVLEAVVRAAAVDDVGRAPQVPPVRPVQEELHLVRELPDLLGGKGHEQFLQAGGLALAVRAPGPYGLDERPEPGLVHGRLLYFSKPR